MQENQNQVGAKYYQIIRLIHTHTHLFIADVVTTATRWKPAKCPPVTEWTSKLWLIHSMEQYSITTRNEVLMHIITCVNLKNMLNEKIGHRWPHIMIPFI